MAKKRMNITKTQISRYLQVATFLVSCASVFGCSKGFDSSKFKSMEQQSLNVGPNSPPPLNKGDFSIAFIQGQRLASREAGEMLEVTSGDLDKIKEIQIEIDGKADRLLSTSPFILKVNLIGKANPVQVKATATFENGKTAVATITITPELVGNGKIDKDCHTNNEFDACIFWKSPIAQKKSPFSPAMTYGDDMSALQVYGVKLEGLTSKASLASKDFVISARSGQKAGPNSEGNYKYKYAEDEGKSFVAQLMAYFWLTEEVRIIKEKSGRFYAEGKRLPISSFDTSVQDNAYWDGQGITMGECRIPGRPSEMALGADVYLHELGHGNMQFAAGNTGYSNCSSADGCIGAINEGQADFHAAIVFAQDPVIGQQFFNKMSGLPGRNVLANSNMTAQQVFSKGGGEVHNMGAVYASLLWELYVHPDMIPKDFAKMFSMHLAMLTNSSTIKNTKSIFTSLDKSQFQGKYIKVIEDVYKKKGY